MDKEFPDNKSSYFPSGIYLLLGFIDVELTEINFPNGRVIFVDERTKKAYLNQNIAKLCGDCGLQEFYDIEQNLLYCPNFTGKIND